MLLADEHLLVVGVRGRSRGSRLGVGRRFEGGGVLPDQHLLVVGRGDETLGVLDRVRARARVRARLRVRGIRARRKG